MSGRIQRLSHNPSRPLILYSAQPTIEHVFALVVYKPFRLMCLSPRPVLLHPLFPVLPSTLDRSSPSVFAQDVLPASLRSVSVSSPTGPSDVHTRVPGPVQSTTRFKIPSAFTFAYGSLLPILVCVPFLVLSVVIDLFIFFSTSTVQKSLV